ncbi:hypothetical protein JCGZ_19388 [Jatropha curcas]|uniref:Uncharacterized protein n=1 Tax=Jatropha curcas TaxID=180498 RepID=A0A067KAK9_JATCU|nr:hypothetical protein JCGZ_19388 [Jatropha curcas]
MARSRAFDSDASGNGSRGGRGPGCSARGRGGTIPPSSSGTSGASSSAQRPVLPLSLPSTPSSSTPISGPVHIYPSSQASRQIMRIIKLQLHKEGYTWDAVPQEARDFYWEEFQAKKLGREPTPIELFTYTHTKDHDLNTFVDRRAMSVNENYTVARERLVSSQTEESELSITVLHWLSSSHNARPQPEYTVEEFTELRARVDDQQRQIAELRAHVMRLSGEHSAGTSSFNPLPATD